MPELSEQKEENYAEKIETFSPPFSSMVKVSENKWYTEWICVVLGMEPRTLPILGKCLTTEVQPKHRTYLETLENDPYHWET